MRFQYPFVLAFLLLAGAPAFAQSHSTFQGVWDDVSRDPDCKSSEYPDFVLMTCEKQMVLWYFTKPNHPAYPGVIKRSIIQNGNEGYAKEEGRSFASDAAQPAFKAWLAQISDLDRQASEWMKNHPDQNQPANSH